MRQATKGDTIVEVILAFGVFSLLAIGTTVAMNRGLSLGQQSLERTLVREQIDSQAELLRYARDTKSPVWQSITDNLATSPGESSFDTCPARPPANAFVMNIRQSPASIQRVALGGGNFSAANYFSRVNLGQTPRSEGLWILPVAVTDGPVGAFDMYIRACWDSVGSSRPMQVSTIVRLYEN